MALTAASEFPKPDADTCTGERLRAEMPLDQILVVGHKSLEELVARTVASTYYKSQKKYLASYLDQSPNTMQSINVSVRVMIADIQKVAEGVVHPMYTHAPPGLPKRSANGGWANAFGKHIVMKKDHVFTGCANYCVGDAWLGLEGSMVLIGVKLGNLRGEMPAQLKELKSLSGEALKYICDFSFKFSNTGECKCNVGKLLLVPPGYIYSCWSPECTALHWGWGCHDASSMAICSETLDNLMDAWPVVRNEDYLSWQDVLIGWQQA